MKKLCYHLLFLAVLGMGTIHCTPTCRTQSDCQSGEFCNLFENTCVQGCESDADCTATTECELETGFCVVSASIPNFGSDAGTSTRTSTQTDAG